LSLERLQEQVRSADAEVRRQGIARVAEHAGNDAVELLMEGLADPDWRVRKEAVQALLVRPVEPYAVSCLVRSLHPGDNVGLRNAAVEALGGFGTLAIDALARELPKLDSDGRKLAAEALSRTSQVAALEPLSTLFKDADPNVRAAATEAVAEVGRLSPEAAWPILEEGLEQQDTFQLLVTLEAIRRLGIVPSWHRLEPLLGEPMLVHVGLQLAAKLHEPLAAQYFVKQLARAKGQSWAVTVHCFAELIESSTPAFEAAQEALLQLSPGASARLMGLCTDPQDPALAGSSLIVLAAKGDGAVAAPAIELLGDDLTAAAAHRALELLSDRALPELEKQVAQGQALESAACVELISRLATHPAHRERVLAALRPLRNAQASTVVRAWLVAAAKIGDEAMFLDVVPWLTGLAPAHVRRAAVSAARVLAQRYPDVARRLAEGVSPEAPEAAAVAVFITSLERPLFGSAALDVEFLSQAVSNSHVGVRSAVLDALSGFSSERAVEAVAFALNDEAQEVQLAALRALGNMMDDGGRPLGTAALLTAAQSKEPTLVVGALQAIGEGADPAALPTLASLIAETAAWRSVAAVEALAQFPEAVRGPGIEVALGHQEPEVVKAALAILSEGAALWETPIVRCLSHPAWDVRRLAGDLLGRYSSEYARGALIARLSSEKEPQVVETLRRSLRLSESAGGLRGSVPAPWESSP
jgi:HEAT repeat protein